MDEPKKRGRKKHVDVKVEINKEEITPAEKKKRGRKKKWETTPFQSNFISNNEIKIIENTAPSDIEKDENYKTNNFKFGNLFIKIHDKEGENLDMSSFKFQENKDCEIYISSDEEDTTATKVTGNENENENKKSINLIKNNPYKNNHVKNDLRCYYCHHHFDNLPFYLPIDYCATLDRYKIFGNFCSPNCAKAYCFDSKTLYNKSYLIGQFYRKIFGPNFRIQPAASIYSLKEYGGKVSIEEFRNNSYRNNKYTLNNLKSKVVKLKN